MISSGPRLCPASFNCSPEEGCGVATAVAAAADGSHAEVVACFKGNSIVHNDNR